MKRERDTESAPRQRALLALALFFTQYSFYDSFAGNPRLLTI